VALAPTAKLPAASKEVLEATSSKTPITSLGSSVDLLLQMLLHGSNVGVNTGAVTIMNPATTTTLLHGLKAVVAVTTDTVRTTATILRQELPLVPLLGNSKLLLRLLEVKPVIATATLHSLRHLRLVHLPDFRVHLQAWIPCTTVALRHLHPHLPAKALLLL
jgi:hypothetical protein